MFSPTQTSELRTCSPQGFAPVAKADGRVRLHVFVDACSIEVFANDGEAVLTALAFPSKADRAVEVFGPKEGATVSAFDVWPLASCWKAQ
jgi:sucrose-6-phosphate hydrolase SacC (GH32 family)